VDRPIYQVSRLGKAEAVPEQHASRGDGADGIGNPLAGDIRRRAVDRLEQAGAYA
jgi:hypothetical protein